MNHGIIYIATNQINLKSYVGLTTDFEKRKREHLRTKAGTHFHKALRKYGADAFEWRVLEDGIPESRLGNREELWIAYYDSCNNGYNSTHGGEYGGIPSDETRAKMSVSQRGRTQTEEAKAKISQANKGRPSPFKGIPRDDSVKAKISTTLTGNPGTKHTDKTKERISESMKAVWSQRRVAPGQQFLEELNE